MSEMTNEEITMSNKQGYYEAPGPEGVAQNHSKAALKAARKKNPISNTEIAPCNKKENPGFELKYEDKPKASTEWIKSHPFEQEQYKQIQLWVDWEIQESDVIKAWEYSTPMKVHDKLVSVYVLPHNVDALEFEEYYNSDIRPLLQKMGEGFKTEWSGSNWIGQFEGEYDDELEVQDAVNGVPTHDIQVFSSISDSFADDSDLVESLRFEDIDFSTIDLNDRKNVEKIRENLEADVAEYMMSFEDFQKELKYLQEEWNSQED